MRLEQAIRQVGNLNTMFQQLMLDAKAYSSLQLADEINQFEAAIAALEQRGENFKALTANMQLDALKSGTEAGGFSSFKNWIQERTALSEQLQKIEMGEVEYQRYIAQQRYESDLAAVEASRQAAEAQIQIAQSKLNIMGPLTEAELTFWQERKAAAEGELALFSSLGERMEASHDKLIKIWSGGDKLSGGSDKRAEALRIINDEIARLTMTEKEYNQYKFDQKIAEYEKLGTVTTEKIKEYRAAFSKSIEVKSFDEANRSLQDFDKQYQQTFKNSGMLTASVTSEMDAFRQAAQVGYGGAAGDAQKLEETLRRIDELQAHKLLESSTYWLDGARRGLHTVSEETGNMAKGMEGLITGTFSQISSSFSFTTDGLKFEWKSLLDYMLDQSMKMLVLNPILSGLSGGLSGLFGGGSGLTLGKFASDSVSGANKTLGAVAQSVKFSAKGNVFDAPALSSYSNSIVSSPTIFPFAKGVGMMGEAGAEAIMPLTRTRSGDLGVQVDLGDIRSDWRPAPVAGGGSSSPTINLQVNIENNTSAQVRASATQDTAGNPVLNIQLIEQIDGALAQRVYNGRSSIGQAIDRTRGTSNARMLYRK